MRKNEIVHKKIQRFMECCAEVQKGNMDNKFYNEQRDKFGKGHAKQNPSSNQNISNNDEGLVQENIWLNQKLDQLQEELKRRTQALNKLKKG